MAVRLDQRRNMAAILDKADLSGLLDIMDGLDKEVRQEMIAGLAVRLTDSRKQAVIDAVKQAVANRDGQLRAWLQENIPESYVRGTQIIDGEARNVGLQADLAKLSVSVIKGANLTLHLDAVNALLSDAYLDFAGGMNGMVGAATRQLNAAAKLQVRAKVIAGQATGASVSRIARDIQQTIGQQGFSVLIDRGGNRWTLKQYSTMLARTHIVKSANEGCISRCIEMGVDLVQVSSHASACEICSAHEGKIYSISGRSDEYPKLSGDGHFHPRCKHTLIPRPDLMKEPPQESEYLYHGSDAHPSQIADGGLKLGKAGDYVAFTSNQSYAKNYGARLYRVKRSDMGGDLIVRHDVTEQTAGRADELDSLKPVPAKDVEVLKNGRWVKVAE
jgi:hypothetical protein